MTTYRSLGPVIYFFLGTGDWTGEGFDPIGAFDNLVWPTFHPNIEFEF